MKTELELQDIEAIAQRVLDLLRPALRGVSKDAEQDTIFDVNGLAKYLQVNPSWVYKQISLHAIPYFKSGKYSRFRKKDVDRWIESQQVRPLSPLGALKNTRRPHDN